MTQPGTGARLGLTPEQMRERTLQQKRESEARRRAARRGDVLQQKRDEQRRNREGYRKRQQEWRAGNPEAHREQQRRIASASPEKTRARRAVNDAIRRGRIVAQPCAVCETSDDVQAHHPDYSKPLEVVWLCRVHHNEVHHG